MNYYLNKLMTYHEVHKMYREGNSIRSESLFTTSSFLQE